jgi:hypothetical protein
MLEIRVRDFIGEQTYSRDDVDEGLSNKFFWIRYMIANFQYRGSFEQMIRIIIGRCPCYKDALEEENENEIYNSHRVLEELNISHVI